MYQKYLIVIKRNSIYLQKHNQTYLASSAMIISFVCIVIFGTVKILIKLRKRAMHIQEIRVYYPITDNSVVFTCR